MQGLTKQEVKDREQAGKVENLSELLIDEGIAKLKNMTTEEIKELFEKEGLNLKSFDKVNGKGSGQKFFNT